MKRYKNRNPIRNRIYKSITEQINDSIRNLYEYLDIEDYYSNNLKYDWKDDSIQKIINARMKEGYTVYSFKKVIQKAVEDYMENGIIDTEQYKFLNPCKIFNKYHYFKYL